MPRIPSSINNAEAWEALAARAGEGGCELASAIRSLYTLYDGELVDWFVGLYDHEIGGFYYSQSAKENEYAEYEGERCRLLPDAESTYQALRFIRSSGMSKDNFDISIPPEMKERISNFVYNLQDPDGFFYHPQWGKNIGASRRGRDAWWCSDMLSVFGREKKYPTVESVPERKNEGKSGLLIPDHMKSREAFVDYLESLNIAEKSYGMGNTLAAQHQMIRALGYMDVCVDYVSAHQHPETGHWHGSTDYTAVNGLMKLSGVYNLAGRPFPHALEAATSAIRVIEDPTPIVGITDLWNIWVAIGQLAANLRKYGGDAGERDADTVVKEVRRIAPKAILISREKIAPFKKQMGSFSYLKDFPAPKSQGAMVTVPFVREGDVNATLMATSELTTSVYSALGLKDKMVYMFGAPEYERFISLIDEKIKKR